MPLHPSLEPSLQLVSELAAVANAEALALVLRARLPPLLDAADSAVTLEDEARETVDAEWRACVHPLTFGGLRFGWLVARSRTEFSEGDARLLSAVADAAASTLWRIEQTQLHRAALDLAQAENRAKDDFLTLLGHELRTPLAAIGLWGSLLRDGHVPTTQLERALDAILSSADGMGRLVDQLLDTARLATGKITLEYRLVDVESLAQTALQQLQPSADAKGVVLGIEARRPLGSARLDLTRFPQILANLLSNAIKFTPPGGRVTLRLRREDARLLVEVTDTGAGISADFMPRLFERFAQADARESGTSGGLGLGLSLTRNLVELHGGTISAESPGPGQGSTLVVRLPWLAQEAEAEPAIAAPSTRAPLNGISVLLAEDDQDTLLALQLTLERAGARVLPAESASVALALAEQSDVAGTRMVLVSDLAMPNMSGYELVMALAVRRRNQGRPLMPACAVSAHARDADRSRALDAGFDLFLSKPITPNELVSAVADLDQVDTTTSFDE